MKSNEIFICLDYSDWCKSSSHKELKLIEFVDIKKSRKGEKHDEWKLWLWYLYNWLTFPCRISTFFHHQNNGIYKSPYTTKRKKEFTGAEVVSTQAVMNVKWKRLDFNLEKYIFTKIKSYFNLISICMTKMTFFALSGHDDICPQSYWFFRQSYQSYCPIKVANEFRINDHCNHCSTIRWSPDGHPCLFTKLIYSSLLIIDFGIICNHSVTKIRVANYSKFVLAFDYQ